jgi:hypothetical protein
VASILVDTGDEYKGNIRMERLCQLGIT